MRNHNFCRFVAQFKRRRQVDVNHRIPVRTTKVQYLIQLTNSGVVHQNINGAKTLTAGGNNLLRGTFLGDIHLHEFNFNTLFLNDFLRFTVIFYKTWDKQIRPGFRQRHRKSLTQTAVAARYDRRFPFQGEKIH